MACYNKSQDSPDSPESPPKISPNKLVNDLLDKNKKDTNATQNTKEIGSVLNSIIKLPNFKNATDTSPKEKKSLAMPFKMILNGTKQINKTQESQLTNSQDEEDNLNSLEIHSNTYIGDPLNSKDWDRAGPPGGVCAKRVRRDLFNICNEPLPGIFVCPNEENLYIVHCLIMGPFGTPYEGGFFHFVVRFGPEYPLQPPRVRLLTTGGSSVRFNPNFYASGKVCLSILNTWSGPKWSAASNLGTVLLSLQSLMNEKPYHNEPGFEKETSTGDCENYNKIIRHETIRVSVCEQLEGIFTGPSAHKEVLKSSFHDFYDYYVSVCEKNIDDDGKKINDPLYNNSRRFQYKSLLVRLKKLHDTIPKPPQAESPTEETSSDESSNLSTSEEAVNKEKQN